MEMDIYFYIDLIDIDSYKGVIKYLMGFFIEKMDSEIKYVPKRIDDDYYCRDVIWCDFFSMTILIEGISKDLHIGYLEEDEGIKVNVDLYCTFPSWLYQKGVDLVGKLTKYIEKKYGSVIVEDDGGIIVYKKSKDIYYIDKDFWEKDIL